MNSTRSCSLKTSFHFRAYRRRWLDAIAISHRSNKTLGNELRTGCRDFSGKLVHLFTVNSFESNHLLFLSPTLPQERSFSGRQTSSIRSQANACIHYFHVSAFFFYFVFHFFPIFTASVCGSLILRESLSSRCAEDTWRNFGKPEESLGNYRNVWELLETLNYKNYLSSSLSTYNASFDRYFTISSVDTT